MVDALTKGMKKGIPIVVGLGMMWSGGAQTKDSIWQEKMLVRDRITRDDGRTLELMGFSISRGDFMVEIDQVERRVTGVSASFQDVDSEMFELLKGRLAENPAQGWKVEEGQELTTEGVVRTIKLDLQGLELSFPDDFVWSVRNSESLDVKLSLERLNPKKISLSLEMNLGDSMNPRQSNLKLLDRVPL